MEDKKLYKIRRQSDGLFSTGGSYPYFSKSGKVWGSLGRLKAHLSQFTGYEKDHFMKSFQYFDCKVVEIEYKIDPCDFDLVGYVKKEIIRRQGNKGGKI